MIERVLLLTAFFLGVTACTTPPPSEYTISRDSLFYLQQLPPTKVTVGSVTGVTDENLEVSIPRSLLFCSADFEDDLTIYANTYIEVALIKELVGAGLYSQDIGAVRIAGIIEHLSISRRVPFKGEWKITLRLRSSNGAQLIVSEDYRFDVGSLAGKTVCRRAIENFEPAVQSLLERALRSNQFPALTVPS